MFEALWVWKRTGLQDSFFCQKIRKIKVAILFFISCNPIKNLKIVITHNFYFVTCNSNNFVSGIFIKFLQAKSPHLTSLSLDFSSKNLYFSYYVPSLTANKLFSPSNFNKNHSHILSSENNGVIELDSFKLNKLIAQLC